MTIATTAAAAALRIGTRIDGDSYEGVLRDGRRIVASCGHRHHNRDESSATNGISARHCIRSLVLAARNPDYATQAAASIRNSMNGYIRAFAASASQAERLRAGAAEAAEEFLASLPAVAEAAGNRPVYGYTDHIEIAPVPPSGVTCRHCAEHIEPQRYGINGWFDWRTMPRRDADCWARGAYSYRGHEPAEEA
jgi:hypothetical protein